MNNAVETLAAGALQVVHTVARHRGLALGAFAFAALASALAIGRVHDRYEASAVIYVDTQTVLKPLMTGLTLAPDVDQQLGLLARTLISKPNVERLLQTPDLGIDVSSRDAREAAVKRLRKQIKVDRTTSTNLYEISYRGESPDRAQRMVEATVDLFVHTGTPQAQESQDAGRFIDEQVRAYEAKLIEAENRLKEFKLHNFGVAGQPGTTNEDLYKRMSALTDGVSRLQVELAGAEHTRDAFRRELAAEEPRALAELPITPNAAAAVALNARSRLALQKRQLADLRMRYTEEHPDVVIARHVIKQLEAEAAAEARGAPGRANRAAVPSGVNPVYTQLRISLADAEAKVDSLRSQLAAQQEQLKDVRAVAARLPQIDAEFARLNRDYDVIRKNYELLVGRRESASLGAKLNQSAQLTEFRLIEPPSVSPVPVVPSRLQLSLAAMLAALAAGVTAPLVVERLRPGFEEPEALQLFGERPVVGAVPMLVTDQGRLRQRASAIGFAAAFGLVFMAQAIWVAWIASTSALR